MYDKALSGGTEQGVLIDKIARFALPCGEKCIAMFRTSEICLQDGTPIKDFSNVITTGRPL